jgi:hypothetical protein
MVINTVVDYKKDTNQTEQINKNTNTQTTDTAQHNTTTEETSTDVDQYLNII